MIAHLVELWVKRCLKGLAERALSLGEFGESPRKQGFALDGVLSGNGIILWLGVLVNVIYKGGQTSWTLKLQLVEKQLSLILARRGRCLVFWLFSSVLRHNYEVVCFDSLHHNCRVTLSDVSVLWECLCPTREHQGQCLTSPDTSWKYQASLPMSRLFFSFLNIKDSESMC